MFRPRGELGRCVADSREALGHHGNSTGGCEAADFQTDRWGTFHSIGGMERWR